MKPGLAAVCGLCYELLRCVCHILPPAFSILCRLFRPLHFPVLCCLQPQGVESNSGLEARTQALEEVHVSVLAQHTYIHRASTQRQSDGFDALTASHEKRALTGQKYAEVFAIKLLLIFLPSLLNVIL